MASNAIRLAPPDELSLAAAPPSPAPEVDAAVRAILAARGTLSIAALASALGVSRQHLARRFNAHVGVPPKMFARVARVRHLLRQVRRARRADWSALAYEMGYADQPHLITEVKAITGLTPRQWAAERGFAG